MANAIFTTKVNPTYDDLPEVRYHFPRTYLNQARQTVGDWIIYYEPRREDASSEGRAGRMAYFAIARVQRIEEDPERADHYYAFVSDYLEFVQAVPFKISDFYPESRIRKSDGSTNKGAFGRAVRLLPQDDFQRILQLGLAEKEVSDQPSDDLFMVAEEQVIYGEPRRKIVVERPMRDATFAKSIQRLYQSTCAMTGLKIINGGGRCEIEAAHIQPVADNGPDSTRNGIALSRTVHWLFDRGLLSLNNDGRILISREKFPEQMLGVLNANRRVILPSDPARRPHPLYLDYHRSVICKGKNLEPLD